MSSGMPFAAVRTAMLVLAAIVVVPAGGYADSPNAAAKKEKAEPRTTALPSNQPTPTAVRSPASFTRQTPLSEAIDILRNSTTPPLKIIMLWRPLNSAGVNADTPIGIDGVAGLRAGQVLDLLVLSLTAGASTKIGYAVDRGVITISTTDALPGPKPVVRVHDVSDLVAPPARYSLQSMGFGMGYGGQMMPFGGYPGSLGAGSSSPTGGTYGNAGQAARTYRSR